MFEVRNNNGPECPNCGYVEDASDGDFYNESDRIECSRCEYDYNMRLHIVYTWITKK